MSSEILLHWLSAYPDSTISEQIIDRACSNIELSLGSEEKFGSDIRRKYLNPLLEFGHIERCCERSPLKYTVLPTTLLEIDGRTTILCGARSELIVESWAAHFSVTHGNHEDFCWIDMPIAEISPHFSFDYTISKVSPLAIMKKLPSLSPEAIGTSSDYQSTENMERYNPELSCWERGVSNLAGVFRGSNEPPTQRPWILKSNDTQFRLLDTSESAAAALTYSSAESQCIALKYNRKEQFLTLCTPQKFHIPLIVKRLLLWQSAVGGKRPTTYKFPNISFEFATELARIFNITIIEE